MTSGRADPQAPGPGFAIGGILTALAVLVLIAALWRGSLIPTGVDAAAGIAFALLMAVLWRFALDVRPDSGGRVSLDTALLLTAAAVLEPAALLPAAGLAPLVGELIARPPRQSLEHRVGAMALNTSNMLLTALAQWSVFSAARGYVDADSLTVQLVLLVAAAFLVGALANVGVGMLTGLLKRGDPLTVPLRYVRSALVWELINIPYAALLILVYGHLGWAAFFVLALGFIGVAWVVRGHVGARREVDNRLRTLMVLNKVHTEITRSLNLEEVFEAVHRVLRESFSADVFNLVLIDRSSGEWSQALRWRKGRRTHINRPSDDNDPVGWVAAHRRSLYVPDMRKRSSTDDLPALQDTKIRSLLVLPLQVEDEVIGVLAMQSRVAGAFDADQRALFTAMAEQIASALANAGNFERATIDGVSGLYLRNYFNLVLAEEAERARRYDRPFAIVLIKFSQFLSLDQTHGRSVADRFISLIGNTLRGRLRSTDMACRYDPDICAVLLRETDREGARRSADRLRDAMREVSFAVDRERIGVRCNLAVAAYEHNRDSAGEAVLQRALEALHELEGSGDFTVVSAWEGLRASAHIKL